MRGIDKALASVYARLPQKVDGYALFENLLKACLWVLGLSKAVGVVKSVCAMTRIVDGPVVMDAW